MKLDLRTPLIYAKIEGLPLPIPENGEYLICYSLNPSQSLSIEPNRAEFLGFLEFIGGNITQDDNLNNTTETISLPQGHYLFMQRRSAQALSQDEWLNLAIEQQKDGLWERNKPENLLYVRFLHEDGAVVTQVFRKLTQV